MMDYRYLNAAELILHPDGSIYHLRLKPGEVASNIILVGDPARVSKVSGYFDKIEYTRQNREIITHTGTFKGQRITVMSTGMGTDNIDIVVNELDALFNIDFHRRSPSETITKLNLIRLGTSGALQGDLQVGSMVASTHGLGIDGVLQFYQSNGIIDQNMTADFIRAVLWPSDLPTPYAVAGSDVLLNTLARGLSQGITLTAPGFYGPQGRTLRASLKYPDLLERIRHFQYHGLRIMNFEMETSALYGLGRLLGHHTLTICALIANRITGDYLSDYGKVIDEMIQRVLEGIAEL